jgi:hypothetical protein
MSPQKCVSRRREKKGRLRRDDRVGYRGVSDFYDPAIRSAVLLLLEHAELKFGVPRKSKTCRTKVRRSQGAPTAVRRRYRMAEASTVRVDENGPAIRATRRIA